MASKDRTAWLVEYVGAKPCPVYATGDWIGFTCSPWDAKQFDTKEEAEAWMVRPGVVAFLPPWKAVFHGFVGVGHVDS